MFRLFPQETISEQELRRGLRMCVADGMCSQMMGVLTGGAFLVALALALGASNKIIGLLAAVGPLAQTLQIPAIILVDKVRLRKFLAMGNAFVSRLFLFSVALIPWILPEEFWVVALFAAMFLYFALGAVAGCAWNSWMRDFVPEHVMGRFFARRMAMSIAVGAILSLSAGFAADYFTGVSALRDVRVYSLFFAVGAAIGIVGVGTMGGIPEPKPSEPRTGNIWKTIAEPFENGNYRSLLIFLGSWSFAVNLAAPFFTVYMLDRLDMGMGLVITLAVVSQVTNILFLRWWGGLSDRFTNKSVLTLSGPLFLVSIALWPFLTMPEAHAGTLPLLVIIHVLAGVSTAGVTLCAGNIGLKISPRGKATAYLASNALVSGIAATVAPIVGGILADWAQPQTLSLNLSWARQDASGTTHGWSIPAFEMSGLDFVFVLAVLFGIYSIHRLLAVREVGLVEEKVAVTEFYAEVRKFVKNVSTVAGLRHLTYFPYYMLRGKAGKRGGGKKKMSSEVPSLGEARSPGPDGVAT